jgi:ABC-type transport system involved in multi-copper enzyme maturation permease subunit
MATFFFYMLLRRLPMLIVMIGGGAVALARWKVHPRSSGLTLFAVIFYFVEAITLLTVRYLIPNWINSMKLEPNAVNTLFTAISVLDDFAFGIIIILLVAAAFSGRRATPASAV